MTHIYDRAGELYPLAAFNEACILLAINDSCLLTLIDEDYVYTLETEYFLFIFCIHLFDKSFRTNSELPSSQQVLHAYASVCLDWFRLIIFRVIYSGQLRCDRVQELLYPLFALASLLNLYVFFLSSCRRQSISQSNFAIRPLQNVWSPFWNAVNNVVWLPTKINASHNNGQTK